MAPGLVLGPSLLLLYVDDIQHASVNAYINLFAEDIKLCLWHKDIKSLYSLVNTELDSLNEWLLANELSLGIGEDKDTKYTLHAPKKYLWTNSAIHHCDKILGCISWFQTLI